MRDRRIRSEVSALILMPWDNFRLSLGMRHLLEMLSPCFRSLFRYYEAAWACGSTPGVTLREYAIVATVVYRMGVRGGLAGCGVGSVAVGLGRVGFYIVRSRFLRRSRVPQFRVPLGVWTFFLFLRVVRCVAFAPATCWALSRLPTLRLYGAVMFLRFGDFIFHVFRRVVVPFARFTSKEL